MDRFKEKAGAALGLLCRVAVAASEAALVVTALKSGATLVVVLSLAVLGAAFVWSFVRPHPEPHPGPSMGRPKPFPKGLARPRPLC